MKHLIPSLCSDGNAIRKNCFSQSCSKRTANSTDKKKPVSNEFEIKLITYRPAEARIEFIFAITRSNASTATPSVSSARLTQRRPVCIKRITKLLEQTVA